MQRIIQKSLLYVIFAVLVISSFSTVITVINSYYTAKITLHYKAGEENISDAYYEEFKKFNADWSYLDIVSYEFSSIYLIASLNIAPPVLFLLISLIILRNHKDNIKYRPLSLLWGVVPIVNFFKYFYVMKELLLKSPEYSEKRKNTIYIWGYIFSWVIIFALEFSYAKESFDKIMIEESYSIFTQVCIIFIANILGKIFFLCYANQIYKAHKHFFTK